MLHSKNNFHLKVNNIKEECPFSDGAPLHYVGCNTSIYLQKTWITFTEPLHHQMQPAHLEKYCAIIML